ncbi:MAG TPA: 6-carboxytetrahydropterin synthase [Gemmatimonadales bacterium]|nr:6-carboxytetrahydropterin synthase [Gemmatimonadales bacterium]
MSVTAIRRVTFEATNHGRRLTYALEASVTGPVDERTGCVIDFDLIAREARSVLAEVIGGGRVTPPSAERLVVAIWGELAPRLAPATLTRLRLWETPDQSAEYDGR